MGQAVARLFAQEGARVVMVARSSDLGPGLAKRIRAAGGEAHFVLASFQPTCPPCGGHAAEAGREVRIPLSKVENGEST